MYLFISDQLSTRNSLRMGTASLFHLSPVETLPMANSRAAFLRAT